MIRWRPRRVPMADATRANQRQILTNQKTMMANQKKILANQARIEGNQKKILANQKRILAQGLANRPRPALAGRHDPRRPDPRRLRAGQRQHQLVQPLHERRPDRRAGRLRRASPGRTGCGSSRRTASSSASSFSRCTIGWLRVDLEDRLRRRHVLARRLEHALEVRAHAVLVARPDTPANRSGGA